MNEDCHSQNLDLVWGAASIARIIRRTPRQTFHLLEEGHLPAWKVGKHWVSSEQALRRRFSNMLPEGEAAK